MSSGGDFLASVLSNYNQFTKAERKVADFVLQHWQEVLFMSITDLADACQVGETTVFRFCKTMQTQGYQEFKIQLSLSIKENPESDKEKTQEVEKGNPVFPTEQLLEVNYNVLQKGNGFPFEQGAVDRNFGTHESSQKNRFYGSGFQWNGSDACSQ